jgi:hypothetical protein
VHRMLSKGMHQCAGHQNTCRKKLNWTVLVGFQLLRCLAGAQQGCMHACFGPTTLHLVRVALGHVRPGECGLHHCLPGMLLLDQWLMLLQLLLRVMQARGLAGHAGCQGHGAREHRTTACGTARACW